MVQISWIAVLVAALTGFVVGGLWYGPLFGKAWMQERGLSEEDVRRGNPALIYGPALILSIVSATFLGHLFGHFDPDPRRMMMMATGVALGFVIPAIGTNYLFSRASLKLFLIDAGYWLAFYAAMGGVFVALG